jgi:hypothetical protein
VKSILSILFDVVIVNRTARATTFRTENIPLYIGDRFWMLDVWNPGINSIEQRVKIRGRQLTVRRLTTNNYQQITKMVF